MNAPDLEALRGRWASAHRRIDAHLRLDPEALRRALSQRRAGAFRRHGRGLIAGMGVMGGVLAALVAFVVSHRADALYLLCALPLLALFGAEWIVDLRQWLALRRLDFAAPVTSVRAQLDTLRARRLRMLRWIFLSCVLLWWPAVAVFFKGLFGVDLVRGLAPSFWWVSLAVGVLFMPLAGGIGWWIARRFGARPGFQQFLDEVAGRSWERAQRALDAQHAFEQALDDGAGDVMARLARGSMAPPHARPALRALRWRLGLGIGLSALAMLVLGVFNAQQGGQWRFLVPGVLLNLLLLAQLVPNILHLNFLARLDYGQAPQRLRALFDDMAALRERVARFSLAVAPLAALLLIQVLGKATFGVDASAAVGVALGGGLLVAGVVAGVWLWRNVVGAPWLTLGSVHASQALARTVLVESAPDSNPAS